MLTCSFSSSAPDRVVYHYSRSLHGFAARLTDDETNRLASKHTLFVTLLYRTGCNNFLLLDPIYIFSYLHV